MKAFARTDAQSMHVEMITVPVPAISDDEVLVSMEAFGVGLHDRYFIPEDAQFPYVIGIEGVGRIAATGKDVTRFAIGDRVVFTSSKHPKGGTWAHYAAVDQAVLMPVPDDLSAAKAATVPIAGRTAIQGLMNLDLAAGETLFIAGASGAIGTFAIQLAVEKGVRVAGSASAGNLEYMQSLGAERTVDYAAADWQAEVRNWTGGGVDAALAIQPNTGETAIKTVRDGGRLITVSGYGTQVPPERGIAVAQMSHVHDTRPEAARLLAAIARGSIKTVIEAEYTFANALTALEKTRRATREEKWSLRYRSGPMSTRGPRGTRRQALAYV